MAVKFQDSPFVFNNEGGEGGVFTRWTKVLAPSLFFSDTIWAGGFPDGSVVKNPLANAGDTGSTLGQEDPLQPTPVVLPGKSHGQRSLLGYSPWGYKESDTSE